MEGDRTELAKAYAARWLEVPILNTDQKQAFHSLDGKDMFVSLPTEFGKLLCFQSLPFAYDYLDNGPVSLKVDELR